jgi:hypothetical protein
MATNKQNSVELLIRARDETQRAIKSAKDGLEAFAVAQARTNARRQQIAAMEQDALDLAQAYRAAADRANELGRQVANAKRPSKALRDEFAAVRAQVKGLRQDAINAAAALGRTTGQVGKRGSFAAFDEIAMGARRAEVAIEAETAALNANTGALGRNAAAAKRGVGARVEDAYTSRKGRGPLGLRPYELQNLGYQVNDVATQLASGTPPMQVFAQQAGQIAQIFPGLISGFIRLAPAIGAATAVLAPFLVSMSKANAEADTLKEFDLLLTRSGEAANYTAPKLAEVARQIDEYAGSLKEARAAVTEFVDDAVAPEYLERFGKTAQDVAKVLKIEVTDAAKKVSDAFTGNADAVLALDDELNFLTDSERKHIEKLRESKKDAEARTQAFAIFERKYNATAEKMRGPWTRILQDFGEAWRAFVDFVNFIDFAKARRQIDDLVSRIQRLTRLLPGANKSGRDNTRATFERNAAELERLREQQQNYTRGVGRGNVALANRIALLEREQVEVSALLKEYNDAEIAARNAVDPPDTTLDPPEPANSGGSRRGGGVSEAERRAKAQAEFVAGLNAENAARRFQIAMVDQEVRERQILETLREKELAAAELGLPLSKEQREEIRQTVGALYDAERAAEAVRLIEQARLELAQAQGQIEGRDDWIARQLRDAGLYTSELDAATGELIVSLTREGQEYADILRTLYDINEATRQRQAAEKAVNDLVTLRSTLMEREEYLRDSGQGVSADAVAERITEINQQLVTAANNAIAMWRAIGGPEAEVAIAALEATRDEAEGVGRSLLISGRQITDSLVNGAASALDQFAQSVAEGQNAIRSLGRAFLSFAADFLREIGRMIFQQAVLNALQSAAGQGGAGGGIGGMFAGAINGIFGGGGSGGGGGGLVQTDSGVARILDLFKKIPRLHSGGLVMTSPVPASVFNTALRYHTGGVVGLKPNEVPIIGLRGEEMLTEDDPRHRANGGLNGFGGSINLKNVNLLNPADLASAMVEDQVGQKVLLNWMQANSRAINAVLA